MHAPDNCLVAAQAEPNAQDSTAKAEPAEAEAAAAADAEEEPAAAPEVLSCHHQHSANEATRFI